MRISDWSSDVCSSDLAAGGTAADRGALRHVAGQGAGDRGSVRAGVLRDGAAAVPAAVRRHQQAYFATGCQYSTDSPQPGAAVVRGRAARPVQQLGRASCRERVCQYVWNWVLAVSLKKKNKHTLQSSHFHILLYTTNYKH